MARKYHYFNNGFNQEQKKETTLGGNTGNEKKRSPKAGGLEMPGNHDLNVSELENRVKHFRQEKVFVRYDEGAELYSMSVHTFMRLAADAQAVYKVNRISLVNTKIFEEYLETFRVC